MHQAATLALSEVLLEPGERIRHVHFPVSGFVSLLSPVDDSTRLEVGLVGDEGTVETPLALGVATSPLQALVQGAGRSSRYVRLRTDPPPAARHIGRTLSGGTS